MNTSRLILVVTAIVLGNGVFVNAVAGGPEQLQQLTRPAVESLQPRRSLSTAVMKPGDQVDLKVWGYSEFNTTTTVNPDGKIAIPLIGEVKADGLTEEQLTEQLSRKLSEYIHGEVRLTLSVTSPTSQKIAVLGAVARQDYYPASADVSLFELLSIAGGLQSESDWRHVKINRRKNGEYSEAVVVDLVKVMESGNLEAIPKVRPGDTVFVPYRKHRVRGFVSSLSAVLTLSSTLASTTLLFLSLSGRI
ncbi:MAG: polysaccharide biosynthesis/export family protein [Candidatus Latescibacteria bacterium]|nr:polysaccharide biosynthesis/export family protein [Candidatus Latescibacterota bacterium]